MYLRTKKPHENNKIEDTMYCREKERDSGLAVTWRNLLNTDNCILKVYMHNPTDRITHTTAFDTPVVEHWLEREIAEWVHHSGSIQ